MLAKIALLLLLFCSICIQANLYPSSLTLLSFNLDGLNPIEAQKRTKYAVKLILQQRPDVIHLQEITFYTVINIKPILERKNYNCSDVESKSVFTMSCIEKAYATNIVFSKKKYTGQAKSFQGKDMLISQFQFGNLPFIFLNVQLESLAVGGVARKAQFAQALRELLRYDTSGPAILSGDIHLRESVAQLIVSKVKNQSSVTFFDAAEVFSDPPNATYFLSTDTMSHRQHHQEEQYRYDRVYCNGYWRVVSVSTIGAEAILSAAVKSPYPTISNHRGIVVEVEVLHNPF